MTKLKQGEVSNIVRWTMGENIVVPSCELDLTSGFIVDALQSRRHGT
jgi:hypothetical protein